MGESKLTLGKHIKPTTIAILKQQFVQVRAKMERRRERARGNLPVPRRLCNSVVSENLRWLTKNECLNLGPPPPDQKYRLLRRINASTHPPRPTDRRGWRQVQLESDLDFPLL